MARIYVIEPGPSGGVGASGALILIRALRADGHQVVHVRVRRQRYTLPEDARRPDAWFVSTLYVRQWLYLPRMFRTIGLAPLAADRGEDDPLVAFGGQVMLSPAPVAPFADVMALGDGEITGVRIARLLDEGLPKRAILERLDGEPGFWTPALYPIGERRPFVRVELPTIETWPLHAGTSETRPVVIELARGCRAKCAFCCIGWAGGTYREADPNRVRSLVSAYRGRRVNLFAPDYSSVSYVEDVERWLVQYRCGNSGTDSRLDGLDRVHAIQRRRRQTRRYNIGIEGWSERLRRAIGKPLDEERILDLMRRLSRDPYISEVKFYQIAGLPGETDEDVEEFLALMERIKAVYPRRFVVTPTMFQSVPHTPLQWARNRFDEEAHARVQRIARTFASWWEGEKARMSCWTPKGRETHELDAALQRMDERAATFLLELDARDSLVQSGRWRSIAARHGLDVPSILDAIPIDASTPWDHVEVGADRRKTVAMWRHYQRIMGIGDDSVTHRDTSDFGGRRRAVESAHGA